MEAWYGTISRTSSMLFRIKGNGKGVARGCGGCKPHQAALVMGSKWAKIV